MLLLINPSLTTPMPFEQTCEEVLNIGERQKGRYRFGKVIDVDNDYNSISNAVGDILSKNKIKSFDFQKFKRSIKEESPSKKIIEILKTNL